MTLIGKWLLIIMAFCYMIAQKANFIYNIEWSFCQIEMEKKLEMQFSHDGFTQLALYVSTKELPQLAYSFLADIKNWDGKIWSAVVCSPGPGLSHWNRGRDYKVSIAPFPQFLKAQPKSNPKKGKSMSLYNKWLVNNSRTKALKVERDLKRHEWPSYTRLITEMILTHCWWQGSLDLPTSDCSS